MLDEQYKEILNSLEEQPPLNAWTAIEKAIRPWYVQPWAKIFMASSFVTVVLVTVYLFSLPINTSPRQASKENREQETNASPSLPTSPADAIHEQTNAATAQTSIETKNKPTNDGLQSNPTSDGNHPNTRLEGDINNLGSEASSPAVNKYNSKAETAGSFSSGNRMKKTDLSLKLSAREICISKMITIKISGVLANAVLDFGDHHQVALSFGTSTLYYTFSQPGIYDVSVTVNNEVVAIESVQVDEKPQAYFKSKVLEDASIEFENLSTSATKYFWFFDDGNQQTAINNNAINHYYSSSSRKEFHVKLIALNTITGCSDTFITDVKNLKYKNYFSITIPDVFTPNGDGLNDVFEIPNAELKQWHIIIVDAAGNMVFETDQQSNYWNGKINNLGNDCRNGTYRFFIKYRQPDDEEIHQKAGIITIIR